MKGIFKNYSSILLGLFCFVFFYSCKNDEPVLFAVVPSSQSHIDFINKPAQTDSLNILDYLYYYNGGGIAVGDVNNDGLPDIYFTANNKGGNKLYLNKGNLVFEDITAKAGLAGTADWCTGVTMADVDADGWLDIYVCAVSGKLGLKGANQLYINNHNGTFTESAAAYGLDFSGFSTQAAFFDYDHDGDLDCYILNQSDHSVEMYGDTSLRRKYNPFVGDKLMQNDGDSLHPHFTDVTLAAGIYNGVLGYGLGIAVADINNDGWEDIYIGNDFHENDYYYVNNHNGTFTESGSKVFNHYSRFSMGNDIADYNNDGQLDIITADMLPGEEKYLKTYSGGENLDIYTYSIVHNGYQDQYSRNALQKNLGEGKAFSEEALMNGIAATDWSWSPLLADYDNDGYKDLFISNGIVKRPVDLDYMRFTSSGLAQKNLQGNRSLDDNALAQMPDGKMHNYIFRGNGDNGFADKSMDWGMGIPSYSNGAAYADLDNDGRLDVIVNNINDEATIYHNQSSKRNYLSVEFKGNNRNTFGIGCKAYIFNKGKVQYQQLMLTRGFQSSSEPRLHFGLDTISVIDSVLIVWPGQHCQLLQNVKANEQLLINQSDAKDSFDYAHFFPAKQPSFTDITAQLNLPWKHVENNYVDFNRQRLMPHELSTRGPKLAVADVTGDGLDDIFVCGARNETSCLFTQTSDGKFVGDSAVFINDKAAEDVDAIFFDADNDGDKDLYVVTGGNEWFGNNAALLDRLYLNDGKGNFTKSVNDLPAIYQNKSTVSVADIDHDGDLDIFVGVLADANAYGIPQTSYILLNDGKAHFTIAGKKMIDFTNIGMITSSAFADVDKDGWQDLIIAGEWMPIKIFINQKGKFVQQDLSSSNGLWQSLYISDIDNDGDEDILAGNYGTNSKLHATEKAPLHLYVKDFDNNKTTDQLMTYILDDKEYTFLGKDELELQLPYIKKTFLKYSDYAGKTVQQIFDKQLDDATTLQVQTLQTTLFINDGKGNFTAKPMQKQAQVSPVFAFYTDDLNHDGKKDIITAGNFYGVIPFEGRYDANWGNIFLSSVRNSYQYISPVSSGFLNRGETRDIKKIKTASGYVYAVAKNSAPIQFFKLNN